MQKLKKELELAIRSRFPLICIISSEEERIMDNVRKLCEERNETLYLWDHADNFQYVTGRIINFSTGKDPLSALEEIDKVTEKAIFFLRDFHQCWHNQPRVIRKLRNLAQRIKYTVKTVVISMPVNRIPEELKDEVVILDVPHPDYFELLDIMKQLLKAPNTRSDVKGFTANRIIRSALGLTSNQAQRVFSKAIVSEGLLDERDIKLITDEKKEIIRESGALEYYSPRETISDVGGLDVMKKWLSMRESAFSDKAEKYGLPTPKGIALVGVPGTGKSLTAKMVASLWGLPLIRLDVGALFGEYVGTSEHNARRALQLSETVSPCIMWIDEIEKSLSTGSGDSGTSMRVLATILSWMQEKTKPVFVVATANNISLLPPELFRRGRFDEIFFLDLPTSVEREEIFRVHIKKRKRDPKKFDLGRLVAASESYVGAEIEQAIIDAMYIAFNDEASPQREFTTEDILEAIHKLVPLSRSQQESISQLRTWLTEGRAKSASFREAEQARKAFVPIEVENPSPADVSGSGN